MRLFSLCAIAVCLLSSAAMAESPAPSKSSQAQNKQPQDGQMVITAEKVTCEKDKNHCIAETNVKVVQSNEEKPNMSQTLTTDHLTVVFEPKKKETSTPADKSLDSSDGNPLGSSEIKEIHAKGNVIVVRGDLVIHANRAQYTADTDIVEFHENVKIKDGDKAYIESPHASMNRKTGTYEVNKKQAPAQKIQIIINTKKSSNDTPRTS